MQAVSFRRAFAGLGAGFVSRAAGGWRWLVFAADALAASLTPSTYTPRVRLTVARHLSAAAVEILPGFVAVSILFSYVVVRIVGSTAREYGLSQYTTDLFVRVLVMELVPLFVALFVALRSGAALATDVALLRERGELEVPAGGGATAARQELLSRGIGVALAVLALTAVASALALVVAYFGLYGLSPWGHAAYSRAIGNVFGPVTAAGFVLKILFFALAVAVFPVSSSLASSRRARSVPQAAPRALVRIFISLALVEAASLAIKYV
jgi:phospholipid/cholesterol/gamma-HCH transport system permease protein